MTAEWKIEPRANLLHARFYGELGSDQLLSAFSDIVRDPAWHIGLDRIFDLTRIDRLNPDGFNTAYISGFWQRQMLDEAGESGRVVIVASDNVAFAMHRMYMAFRALPEEKFTIVRRLESAFDFLGVDPVDLYAEC